MLLFLIWPLLTLQFVGGFKFSEQKTWIEPLLLLVNHVIDPEDVGLGPPPNVVYPLENDFCGEYVKEPIYDYEMIYTADGKPEWRSLNSLKLPVFCKYCKDIVEVGAEGTKISYEDSINNFEMVVASIGEDFFGGSNVCLYKRQGDYGYELSPFFQDQMQKNQNYTQQWKTKNLLDLVKQDSPRFTIPRSVHNSTIHLTDEIFGVEFAQKIKNQQMADKYASQSLWPGRNLNFSSYNYPEFLNIISPLNEECDSISPYQKFDNKKDEMAVWTLYLKGWGCTRCQQAKFEYNQLKRSFSYAQVTGYDKIPTNEQFKQEDIYLERKCDDLEQPKVALNSKKVTGEFLFHEHIDLNLKETNFTIVSCHEIIHNCALCSQKDPSQCRICLDGYALTSYKDNGGQAQSSCLKDFCPSSFRKVTNLNGMMHCEKCSIQNCQECIQVKAKTKEVKEFQTFDMCLKCEGQFELNDDKTKCQKKTNSEHFDVNYIIDSYDQSRGLEVSKTDLQIIQIREEMDKLYFIQQALSKLDKLSTQYKTVNATIWLGRGDHFFIQCDTKREKQGFCGLPSMRAFFPATDNVNITIRGINCLDWEAKLMYKDQSQFFKVCSKYPLDALDQKKNSQTEEALDQRPVIYVNGNHFYFNITKQANFIDVIFDGINQFSAIGKSFMTENDNIVGDTQISPKKFCQWSVKNSSSAQLQYSSLIQQVINSESEAQEESDEDFSQIYNDLYGSGWGKLNLESTQFEVKLNQIKPLLPKEDVTENDKFSFLCEYTGDKFNLYSQGVNELIKQMLIDYDEDHFSDIFPQQSDHETQEFIRQQAILKDKFNYLDHEFNNFEKLDEEDDSSQDQAKSMNFKRRKVLFNLYAFTFSDSWQKDGETLDEDNYQIPTLKFRNVEVRNFLNDYQSLIHVENDNYITRRDHETGDTQVIHFGNYEALAHIDIDQSYLVDSSFSNGMIFVPPVEVFNLTEHPIQYRHQDNYLEEHAESIMKQRKIIEAQQKIQITRSQLQNLNYGQVLLGLNQMESQFTLNRGIILSVQTFQGPVILSSNSILQNMVFVPSAIFSNARKFNQSAINYVFSDFIDDEQILQFSVDDYSGVLNHNVHFFNYYDPQTQDDELENLYQTVSPIYLRNVTKSYILFQNNTVSDNIGMHGGVINIDFSQTQYQDYSQIYFVKNNFQKNMAYFKGNAIYIRGQKATGWQQVVDSKVFQIGLMITDCHFQFNQGLNIADGGAISIDGRQPHGLRKSIVDIASELKTIPDTNLTYFSNKIAIEDSNFIQNTAGQKSSCINIQKVQQSSIELKNLTFLNNTGSYSFLEKEYKTPFYQYLTSGKLTLNFLSFEENECQNEIEVVGRPWCLDMRYNTDSQIVNGKVNPLLGHQLHFQYPHMKGVVHVQDVRDIVIKDSVFSKNDAGPILTNLQIVGAIDNTHDYWNVQRASAIFIGDYPYRVSINNCTFQNNTLTFIKQFVKNSNHVIFDFFPPDYFEQSHSPQININSKSFQYLHDNETELVEISESRFLDQRNQEILGFSMFNLSAADMNYYSSLLHVRSRQSKFQLKFTENVVHNQIFRGFASSLIQVIGSGEVHFENNQFLMIGYLSNHTYATKLPYDPKLSIVDAYENLTFYRTEAQQYQNIGIFDLQNSKLGRDSSVNLFKKNTFRNIYAYRTGIYKVEHTDQSNQGSLRYKLESNSYHEIFAEEVAIFQHVDSIIQQEVYNVQSYDDISNHKIGLIVLEDETVTQSQGSEISLYDIRSQNDLVSILIRNSTFSGNYRNVFKIYKAHFFAYNCTFSQKEKEFHEHDLDKENHYGKPTSHNLAEGQHYQNSESFDFRPKSINTEGVQLREEVIFFKQEKSSNGWLKHLVREYEKGNDLEVDLVFQDMADVRKIYSDFNLDESAYAAGSQFIDCKFVQFQILNHYYSIIGLVSESRLMMRGCYFNDIQTIVIHQHESSVLYILDSQVEQIGSKIPYRYKLGSSTEIDPEENNKLTAQDYILALQDGSLESRNRTEFTSSFLKSTKSRIHIVNTDFKEVVTSQGLFYTNDGTHLLIANSTFSHLVGVDYSALMFSIQNLHGKVMIRNSTIRESMATSGMISLTFSRVSISNSSFLYNYARLGANGISMIFSEALIENSILDNSMNNLNNSASFIRSPESGFINMNYQSKIEIRNSLVQGFTSSATSFLISSGQSQVLIEDCTILNNTSREDMITNQEPKSFKMINTTISQSNGINIDHLEGFLIQDTEIYDPLDEKRQIYIKGSQGEIKNTILRRTGDTEVFGLTPSNVKLEGKETRVSFLNCTFFNLTADDGAAIHSEDVDEIQITRCTFKNNAAAIGGAIYLENTNKSIITESNFINNKAVQGLENGKINMIKDQNLYRGGAIYIDCEKSDKIVCNTSLASNNTFLENKAGIQGGAIAYRSEGIKHLNDHSNYTGNTAGIHSPTISSFATNLIMEYDQNYTTLKELEDNTLEHLDYIQSQEIKSLSLENGISTLLTFPSGEMLDFTLTLKDENNVTISNENTATATISLLSIEEYQSRRQLLGMNMNSSEAFDNYAQITNNFAQCQNGTFKFDRLKIIKKPGQIGILKFEIDGLDENGIDKDFLKKPKHQMILSRQCKSGEQLTKSQTCEVCGFGFYLIQPPDRQKDCKPCLPNAICNGSYSLAPKYGYFRTDDQSEEIIKCRNHKSCLEGDEDNPLGKCRLGYKGHLCGSCEKNYVNNYGLKCRECLPSSETFWGSLGKLLWLTFLIVGISKINESYSMTRRHHLLQLLLYIKIMINHAVILMAIDQIDFGWDPAVKYGLQIIESKSIVPIVADLIHYRCLVTSDDGLPKFFQNLIFTMLFPFIMAIWIAFVLTFNEFINWRSNKSTTREALRLPRNRIHGAIMITFWILQPSVLLELFKSITCVVTSKDQPPRLYQDLDVICWTGQHKSFMILVVICLIIWVFCFPAYVYFNLRKNKQQIKDLAQNEESPSHTEKLVNVRFQRRYGFLFVGVKKNYYLWEIYNIARKVIILGTCDYLASQSNDIQCLITIIFVIVSLIVIINHQPFIDEGQNILTIFSQFIQMWRMYIGLFFILGRMSTDEYSFQSVVGSALLLVPTLAFLFKWINMIYNQFLINLLISNRAEEEKSQGLFKVFTCGTVDQAKFLKDNSVDLKEYEVNAAGQTGRGEVDDPIGIGQEPEPENPVPQKKKHTCDHVHLEQSFNQLAKVANISAEDLVLKNQKTAKIRQMILVHNSQQEQLKKSQQKIQDQELQIKEMQKQKIMNQNAKHESRKSKDLLRMQQLLKMASEENKNDENKKEMKKKLKRWTTTSFQEGARSLAKSQTILQQSGSRIQSMQIQKEISQPSKDRAFNQMFPLRQVADDQISEVLDSAKSSSSENIFGGKTPGFQRNKKRHSKYSAREENVFKQIKPKINEKKAR